VEGFAVYSKKATPNLETPIILVLGGSTTDGVHNDHSWPEELSKLLAQRKVSGIVVNGGTSGYSSNQELLKLLRDGLEFKPNIIISYSGVNDRGDYGKLPYPMVHPYQRATLKFLTSPAYSPLFPNTIYFLNGILWGSSPVRMSATLGIPTRRTLGQQFERNMILMDAIARASGATFYGIIQPNDYVGSGGQLKGPKKEVISKHYVAKLRNFYGQIRDVPVRLPFVRSFISIFDGEDTTYADDGVHTTLKGDQIIAARVLDLIYADLRGSEITRAPAQSAPCIKQ
jgi:lysophospholipase L1-like esterase